MDEIIKDVQEENLDIIDVNEYVLDVIEVMNNVGPRGPKGDKGDIGDMPDMQRYYTATQVDELFDYATNSDVEEMFNNIF